jgi:hypothetical protein
MLIDIGVIALKIAMAEALLKLTDWQSQQPLRQGRA